MLLTALAPTGMATFAATKTGWVKSGGAWYYYDSNGDRLGGGVYVVGKKAYAFDGKGRMVTKKGWYSVKYGDSAADSYQLWYYLDGNGVCLTGWQKISGSWYYFDKEYGTMYTASSRIGSKLYLFDSNGKLVEQAGWYEQKWSGDDTAYYYYLKSSGEVVTGWQKIGGKWYYFNEEFNGLMAQDGGLNIDGRAYFFTRNGVYYKKTSGWLTFTTSYGVKQRYYFSASKPVTGWKTVSGKKYYFLNNGVMATGMTYVEKNKKLYYFAQNGVLKKYTGWKTLDGDTYYFSKYGYALTGWRTLGGKKRYFGTYDGAMYKDGVYYIESGNQQDGAYYCFNSKGMLRKGWLTVDGATYYGNKSGKLLTGWQKIDGKTYYFNPWDAQQVKGAYQIKGVWYYFDETTGVYDKNHSFG